MYKNLGANQTRLIPEERPQPPLGLGDTVCPRAENLPVAVHLCNPRSAGAKVRARLESHLLSSLGQNIEIKNNDKKKVQCTVTPSIRFMLFVTYSSLQLLPALSKQKTHTAFKPAARRNSDPA